MSGSVEVTVPGAIFSLDLTGGVFAPSEVAIPIHLRPSLAGGINTTLSISSHHLQLWVTQSVPAFKSIFSSAKITACRKMLGHVFGGF